MHDMQPYKLTAKEWEEIAALESVREQWGGDGITPDEFAYGVRFNFMSGSPGYVGDLYILQSDHLTGDAPMILTRDKSGRLSLDYWYEVLSNSRQSVK